MLLNIVIGKNTYVSSTTYDSLDRLFTWKLNNIQQEGYAYYGGTGNLSWKGGVQYTYDANHVHAVSSLANGNNYGYDNNGNQITRVIGGVTFNLSYDAENRLKQVKKTSAVIAKFTYDADGKRVKSVMGTETTLFIGAHYEILNPGSGQTVSKYYFAGTTKRASQM